MNFLFLINNIISKNHVQVVTLFNSQVVNDLNAEYSNATIEENSINERLYIKSFKDSQVEYLSLPLQNCIVKTTH